MSVIVEVHDVFVQTRKETSSCGWSIQDVIDAQVIMGLRNVIDVIVLKGAASILAGSEEGDFWKGRKGDGL